MRKLLIKENVDVKPTIKVYDNEGNLTRAYNNAIKKMIDNIHDIDLEQFDFDEVAKGKSKELDDLVVKLCNQSGLGSKDIYSMLWDRFQDEYGVEFEFEIYESLNKSIKESYKGLNPEDSCDYALSVCDKSMIKEINALSDAWELYNKSWEKFYDIYDLSDIEEMYLEIKDCLDETHEEVIEKWMEDIEMIYYSKNKMSQINPTFGFKGNDLFESKKNKNMKKSIKERFNAPKDWDFEEMVEQYGMEYLGETNPDVEPYPMDEFNELTSYQDDPLEAITRAFYGGRYGFKNDSFSPMDEYFAYDGYSNLISIGEYYFTEYLTDHIDEPYFYDWCVDNGYFEVEEDDE